VAAQAIIAAPILAPAIAITTANIAATSGIAIAILMMTMIVMMKSNKRRMTRKQSWTVL